MCNKSCLNSVSLSSEVALPNKGYISENKIMREKPQLWNNEPRVINYMTCQNTRGEKTGARLANSKDTQNKVSYIQMNGGYRTV